MDERRLIYLVIRSVTLLALIYNATECLSYLDAYAVGARSMADTAGSPGTADLLGAASASALCSLVSVLCFRYAWKLVSWIDGPPPAQP